MPLSFSQLSKTVRFAWRNCFAGHDDALASRMATPLEVESLESRQMLSATVTIDYSLDTTGFFDVAERRDALDEVAAQVSELLGDSLDAIEPSGSQDWTPRFFHPGTGEYGSHADDLVVAEDQIVIFAGGFDLQDTRLGQAAPGTFFTTGGGASWFNSVAQRGESGVANQTDYAPWGGSIMFDDTDYDWHFGSQPPGSGSGQYDFRTVALHEIFHVLGVGSAPSWDAQIVADQFTGAAVTAEFDGEGFVGVDPSHGHFVGGTFEDGRAALMGPYVSVWNRNTPTALDLAALTDIGWEVTGQFPQQVEAYVDSAGLYVDGTDDADEISVFRVGNQLEVTADDVSLGRFDRSEFSVVVIDSLAGDDTIRINLNVTDQTFIYTRGGNDTVYGGSGDDFVVGFEGNDRLFGRAGNDSLHGGEGDDFLLGQAGDDYLSGADGVDELRGGIGNDTIYAGEGDDFIEGAAGDDRLFGFNGRDTIYAGSGNDVVYGQNGNDWIYASRGDDLILGGDGRDVIFGQFGTNQIDAGAGDDSVAGGTGIDIIDGGDGNDRIYGGADSDQIQAGAGDDFVHGGYGNDYIAGGDGNDLLYGNFGTDYLYGGLGNDTLHGVQGNDWLFGEAGNDLIYGGDGEDTIGGGLNDDRLFGGAGNDVIRGNGGDDRLAGGDGNDLLEGGGNNDLLLGAFGDDQLFGQLGDDELRGGLGSDLLDGGEGIDTATDFGELGQLGIEFS